MSELNRINPMHEGHQTPQDTAQHRIAAVHASFKNNGVEEHKDDATNTYTVGLSVENESDNESVNGSTLGQNQQEEENPDVFHAVAAVAATDSMPKNVNDIKNPENSNTPTPAASEPSRQNPSRFKMSGDSIRKSGISLIDNIKGIIPSVSNPLTRKSQDVNETAAKVTNELREKQNNKENDYEAQINELQKQIKTLAVKHSSDLEKQGKHILNSKSIQSFIPIFRESIQETVKNAVIIYHGDNVVIDDDKVNNALNTICFLKQYRKCFDYEKDLNFSILDTKIPHSLPMKEKIKLKIIYFLSKYQYKNVKLEFHEIQDNNNDAKVETMFYNILVKFQNIYLEIKEKSYDDALEYVNKNMMIIPKNTAEEFKAGMDGNEFEAKKLLLLYVIQNLDLDY